MIVLRIVAVAVDVGTTQSPSSLLGIRLMSTIRPQTHGGNDDGQQTDHQIDREQFHEFRPRKEWVRTLPGGRHVSLQL